MLKTIRTLLAAALCVGAGVALAQDYPGRQPIRIIAPFAAGGTTDVMARVVAQKLGETLGHSVIVENKVGAGGNIGAEFVARAAPDGYTLLLGTPGPLAINESLFKSLSYSPSKSFAPIGRIADMQSVVITHPNSQFKTLADVLAYAKANPGKLTFASGGIGSTPHLAAELMFAAAGVRLNHVPYKGDTPGLTDVAGGHVPLMSGNLPGLIALVNDGKVRPLAVSSARRSALLPNVPTVAEAGVPGYAVNSWIGLLAPAGTPPAIIARLNTALNKALASPEIAESMKKLTAEVVRSTPEEFARLMASEQARWAKVINDHNIKLD
jgi:tripartite-type tricarboxylate transporter receptor subunit TctC